MLNQLKEDYQGAYTKEHVRELEQMETLLRMDRFDSGDALRLGNQIVREAEKYGEDLIVRIIRMTDALILFSFKAVTACLSAARSLFSSMINCLLL